jgi:hypothetical protein
LESHKHTAGVQQVMNIHQQSAPLLIREIEQRQT